MLPKPMQTILHALSYGGIELEASRRLADIKKLDPMRIFLRKLDEKIYNGDYPVPVRLYFPNEEAMKHDRNGILDLPLLLFFHGGGWVTESVENYDRVCARMSQDTGQVVASVEYRLAPEHRFPKGLTDCYAVAREFFKAKESNPDQITIIGDSAGGNLAAAVCMMARDRKEFSPKKQILIYPALYNCYTEDSPFASVKENGQGYLLTSEKMCDYLELYQQTEEDRQNKYFAPLLATDYSNLPKTLLLTAELDPLRDEGEEYGRRLAAAGVPVEHHRIADAFHGFFALGIKFLHVQESFGYINAFLKDEQPAVSEQQSVPQL